MPPSPAATSPTARPGKPSRSQTTTRRTTTGTMCASPPHPHITLSFELRIGPWFTDPVWQNLPRHIPDRRHAPPRLRPARQPAAVPRLRPRRRDRARQRALGCEHLRRSARTFVLPLVPFYPPLFPCCHLCSITSCVSHPFSVGLVWQQKTKSLLTLNAM